ncbi:hypothetical protein T484DRAFT_1791576 [Baffinella frigidus]|nr:hypothetical protein T484DRAFT_1791576 [Cryptophyta sp. CCMP2293]
MWWVETVAQKMGRRAFAGVAAALALCLVIYSGHADSSAVRHFDTMAEAAVAASEKAHLAKLEEEGGTAEGEKQVNLKVEYKGQTANDKAYEADREKFSAEHPDEALKIHLKRKAERQAALREEYHKKREEMLERLGETNRARSTVVAILIVIIITTIAIDFCARCAIHGVDDFSNPVVMILFKELTVLNLDTPVGRAPCAVHGVDDFSKPVVMILFKELTVLGCIALLVFMSVKTGVPQQDLKDLSSIF